MTNPSDPQDHSPTRATRFPGGEPPADTGRLPVYQDDPGHDGIGHDELGQDDRPTRPVRRITSGSVATGRDAQMRRRRLLPLWVGLGVFLLGLLATMAAPIQHTASVNLVVVPGNTTPSQAASLFDTLSRGQIVATASEIYSQPRWTAGHSGVSVTAGGVTPSAVMTVTATGPSDQVATALTDGVRAATPTVNRAIAPYRVMGLSSGTPTVTATGVSRGVLLLVSLVAAALAALLVAALLRLLARRADHA